MVHHYSICSVNHSGICYRRLLLVVVSDPRICFVVVLNEKHPIIMKELDSIAIIFIIGVLSSLDVVSKSQKWIMAGILLLYVFYFIIKISKALKK